MGLWYSKSGAITATKNQTSSRQNQQPRRAIEQHEQDTPVSSANNTADALSVQGSNARLINKRREEPSETEGDSAVGFSYDHETMAINTEASQSRHGQSWEGDQKSPHIVPDTYQVRSPINRSVVFERRLVHNKPTLKIKCPSLLKVLETATLDFPGISHQKQLFSNTTSIDEPYQLIFYNWNKIQEVGQRSPIRTANEHVQLLLEFVKSEHPFAWEKLDDLASHRCREIIFDDLWLIYPPGTTVYRKDNDDWRAYKVERVESGNRASSDATTIYAYYIDFDGAGKYLIPQLEVLKITPYPLKRYIQNLEVVPDWAIHNQFALEGKLIERGITYCEYGRNEVSYCEYKGDAWPGASTAIPTKVVVDYVTGSSYRKELGAKSPLNSSSCSVCLGERLGLKCYPEGAPHDPDICQEFPSVRNQTYEDSISAPQDLLLFCAPRLWAFSMWHKTWEMVRPQQLSRVEKSQDAMSKLRIDPARKEHLDSIVFSYINCDNDNENRFDIGGVKGRGCNVLLYGKPGTGKTLAVECLAEKYGRPLYVVTTGELGIDLDVLERRLQEISWRAKNWNAVTLIEEADIYVQTRQSHDVKRNALISIFLRHLDYSDALLVITTNMVNKIDPAISLRMTLTVGFPDLSFIIQQAIWSRLVENIRIGFSTNEENVRRKLQDFIQSKLEDLEGGAYTTMNGRQIKNCISAAMAVANKKNGMNAR
ncbi:putative AAA+ ATPase domain-containing protein [Seiridium cardinale]